MTTPEGGRGHAQQRMTPEQLRDLIKRAGITQARAADLAGVSTRAVEQYLAPEGTPAHRRIPLSVSGLLCLSLILLGGPAGLLAPWLHPDLRELVGEPSTAG